MYMESREPKISVVVPVYNVEKYLRRCLDSICGQTYRNLEIICVNDGSTDGSLAILEEYAARDSRVCIITQQNAGLSAARNTALEHATGEWIAGVDSDDYLDLDAYEYAIAGVDDEIDIICYGTRVIWQNIPPDIRMEQYLELSQQDGQPSFESLTQISGSFWNKLWRRKLVKQYCGSFPVGLWFEDVYFYWTLAPFARKISYRPEKKYNYIRHGCSIMSKAYNAYPKIFDYLEIAKRIQEFYLAHPLPEHLKHLRLFTFIVNFSAPLEYTLKDKMQAYWREAYTIARQYGLIRQYPAELRFLKPVPWFLRLFVKHKTSKSYYGLPGLPLLTITRKAQKEEFRFLWIKICSRPFASSMDKMS